MSDTLTTTYAQTVTRLAREYNETAVDGEVLPADHFRIITELHDAADRAGISRDVATADLKNEVEAGPVGA